MSPLPRRAPARVARDLLDRGVLRVALAALALLLPLGVTGCSSASDGRPQVVAAFYPLQFVAERIVGDHAQVSGLTQPGVEPHDLELTPRQVARLAGADVGFYEKGLQPAVDQAIRQTPPDHVVDAAAIVTLRPVDSEDPLSHDEDHAESDDGHEHRGLDPHFWLDPTLLAETADAFASTMAEADPEHADAYRTANVTLQRELADLDAEYRSGLARCSIDTVVVSHDAFGYLGARYGLRIAPITGVSPDAEPSARYLAALADLAREHQVTTIFSERLASPKLAETLAADLGLDTAVLDPIEGLTSADSDADYLSLMRANLAALTKANSCR